MSDDPAQPEDTLWIRRQESYRVTRVDTPTYITTISDGDITAEPGELLLTGTTTGEHEVVGGLAELEADFEPYDEGAPSASQLAAQLRELGEELQRLQVRLELLEQWRVDVDAN